MQQSSYGFYFLSMKAGILVTQFTLFIYHGMYWHIQQLEDNTIDKSTKHD